MMKVDKLDLSSKAFRNFRQKNREDDYRMDTFHSGESLLMSSRSYDLIFLDIQMNGMDGIETAKKFGRGIERYV